MTLDPIRSSNPPVQPGGEQCIDPASEAAEAAPVSSPMSIPNEGGVCEEAESPTAGPAARESRMGEHALAGQVMMCRTGEPATREPVGDTPAWDAGGDPSLDHIRQVCDPNLSQQPLESPPGCWDGSRILTNLSQVETAGQTPVAHQQNRCGASSVLAGAVMAGPEATARVADRLGATATDPQEAARLNGIRDRILDGSATHADLNALQESMYGRYLDTNRDPSLMGNPYLYTGEVTQMQRDLASGVTAEPAGGDSTLRGTRDPQPADGYTDESPGRTDDRLANLRPGESFTMLIDTDRDGASNHFVQVGRDQDGRAYVYDPWPRTNQPNMFYEDQNPKAVGNYLHNYGTPDPADASRQVNTIVGGTVHW